MREPEPARLDGTHTTSSNPPPRGSERHTEQRGSPTHQFLQYHIPPLKSPRRSISRPTVHQTTLFDIARKKSSKGTAHIHLPFFPFITLRTAPTPPHTTLLSRAELQPRCHTEGKGSSPSSPPTVFAFDFVGDANSPTHLAQARHTDTC